MQILETERLILREMTTDDSAFILDLLNQPSFIKYIGDRGVRDLKGAAEFIENRYRQSYRDHGYGLYVVEIKSIAGDGDEPIGICGFVRRDTLPGPDIGFAFLPQFEKKGYAYESAAAMMDHGREALNFECILAITTTDNDASVRLLEKLGFKYDRQIESNGEKLKLFSFEY